MNLREIEKRGLSLVMVYDTDPPTEIYKDTVAITLDERDRLVAIARAALAWKECDLPDEKRLTMALGDALDGVTDEEVGDGDA